MPSPSLELTEYALLAALGASVWLDRKQPEDVALSPSQFAIAHLAASVLSVVLLLTHHWRKEMIPAYITAILRAASHAAPTVFASVSPLWLERVSIAGVLLAIVMLILFPLPNLAVLHGKYKTIGCRTVRFGGVECNVFYPSAIAPSPVPATQRVKYLHHGIHLAKGINRFAKFPVWFFNNLQNAYLSAIRDVPVAAPERASGWPVVIFSHGLGGSIEMYSFITQQMASAGNIVVVLSHGDGSASVTRPEDDRIEYYQPVSDAVRNNIDGEGFRFRNNQLRHRVQEVRRVLNAITDLTAKDTDRKDELWSSVDLQCVHVVGHSFGAATALTTAHLDERFRTVVLLDAWMEPVDNDTKQGLGNRVPVLHLVSDPYSVWKENADRVKRHAAGCSHPKTRVKRIAGSRHNNFCDLPLFSPIMNRLLKSSGSIDPKYVLRMIGQLSAAFIAGEYDDAVHEFPEVLDLP